MKRSHELRYRAGAVALTVAVLAALLVSCGKTPGPGEISQTGEDPTVPGTSAFTVPEITDPPVGTEGEESADSTGQPVVSGSETSGGSDSGTPAVTDPNNPGGSGAVTTAGQTPSTTADPPETVHPGQIGTEAPGTSPAVPPETTGPVPACLHSRTSVTGSKAPTCTAAGYTGDTVCADCGAILSAGQSIAAAGHRAEVSVAALKANCTSDGRTEGLRCAVCGLTLQESRQIPALGHTVEQVAAVPATCQKDGTAAGTRCTVCGKILSGCTFLPKTDHTPVTVPASAPDCGSVGLSEGVRCSVCGTVIVAQRVVPAVGHDYSVQARTVAPQVGMPGYTVYRCSKCGAEDPNGRDIVPMLPGDYGLQNETSHSASSMSPSVILKGPGPVQAIELQGMEYELHPDNTRDEDGFPLQTRQNAVLTTRDGTKIYGHWYWYGKTVERKDTENEIPNPGWTFVMDSKPYAIGESCYGWCYNRLFNTFVYGWWYWDSYGGGNFTPLDSMSGFTNSALKYTYRGTSPKDSAGEAVYNAFVRQRG